MTTDDKPILLPPDPALTGVLSDLGTEDQGTLVSLIVHKKGVARGPASSRIIYDDDFVHVLLWAGFPYADLVARSQKKLELLWDQKGKLERDLIDAVREAGHGNVNLTDVSHAIQDIHASFEKVLVGRELAEGRGDDPDEFTGEREDSVWEPLTVEGVVVRGAKVYNGQARPDDHRAPVPGNIYLDGVKLGEKVLTPAANGRWPVKSKAKTLAKNILRSWLPAGLYVRYSLEPERRLTLQVGKTAGQHAKAEGVIVDPEAIRQLFKIAA